MDGKFDDVVRGVPVGLHIVHQIRGVAESMLDEQIQRVGTEIPGWGSISHHLSAE